MTTHSKLLDVCCKILRSALSANRGIRKCVAVIMEEWESFVSLYLHVAAMENGRIVLAK